VSPPWLGRRICKNAFAKSRQTADGVLTNAGADAVAEPRGAYAPRPCSRVFAGPWNCDFCDAQTYMHRSGGREPAVVIGDRSCQDNSAQIRTPPSREASRAAGVSPPCVAATHLQRRFRNCSADCRPVRWRTPLQSRPCNHGGLRPPALVPAKMLSCIAKVAFSPPSERRAPGAAGVNPPWLQEPRLQRQFPTHSDTVVAHAPRAEGVSPPWFGRRTYKGVTALAR